MAGIAYLILAVVALTRISSYPSLDLSETELTAWFDDDVNQALLVGALGLASVSACGSRWSRLTRCSVHSRSTSVSASSSS
jgi:hypothetical protein